MNNDFLDDMALPSSSSKEDLETISRGKLALLFDPALFEIRPEVQRDKGIDLIIEIKKYNKYTNFRFAVQLKSTKSVKSNKDSSLSFSIEISNINYLLNYGMPTYYILYDHTSERFFLEHTSNVYKELIQKYKDTKFPESYNVRFSTSLTEERINEVYKQTLDYGVLIRRLNFQLQNSTLTQSKGLIIDDNNEVYSVEQNVAFIDQFGFTLLNNTNFDQIIEIEQRTYPRTMASPTFNLVCGIAYFQRANLFKAIELLKLAQQEAKVFPADYQAMLVYTLLNARYLIGLLRKDEFQEQLNALLGSDGIGSFLKIEKVYKSFLNTKRSDREGLEIFCKELDEILSKEKDNHNIRVMAYGQILQVESKILINDLSKNFVFICGKFVDPVKSKTYQKWLSLEDAFIKRLDTVIEFALKKKNFMAMSNLSSIKNHWIYTKIFLTHLFKNWNNASFDLHKELDADHLSALQKVLEKIEVIAKTYEILRHNENLIVCLSDMYEVLIFLKRKEEAANVSKRILQIIEENELNGIKQRYVELVNGGTSHEKFINYFTSHIEKIHSVARSSGIDEKFLHEIPSKKMQSILENNIQWTIKKFHKLTFPS